MSRSSAPLSQCSPNLVHPIPMIATRSLMPLLPMVIRPPGDLSALWPCLPEIVVNTSRSKEAAKRHFDFMADGNLIRFAIGHLAQEPSSAIEVDDDIDCRRIERIRKPIDGVGRNPRGAVRKWIRFHLITRPALNAYALRWKLRSPARSASRADETELPLLSAEHRRSSGTVGVGTAGRLG